MTDPVSQITLADGTSTVNVSGFATLGLEQTFTPVGGGSTVTRFLDGTAIKQTSWTGKWQIIIRGNGWVPSGLWGIDYSLSLTLTVQDDSGTEVYTVFAKAPDETWNINEARSDWTLTAEEV